MSKRSGGTKSPNPPYGSKAVQFRWYNELSFEDMLKDAAKLTTQCNFLIGLNVDAAGVAHETTARSHGFIA
jgi:hypothetical protein